MLAFIISSCGKENVTPGSGNCTTGGNVPDPVGTIKLSMRNASNGKTLLGSHIYIDNGDNFTSSDDYKFASVGKVNGLGNVTGIPTGGWAEKIAVVPGEGVLALPPRSGSYCYRIYVQDYVRASGTNGVIGADIKYQAPFHGMDEAVKFDRESITINSEGGSEVVHCTNTTIIPFATLSSSEDWCIVPYSYYSTVHVRCGNNPSESSRTATITVTTYTDKQTTFTVTQTGH